MLIERDLALENLVLRQQLVLLKRRHARSRLMDSGRLIGCFIRESCLITSGRREIFSIARFHLKSKQSRDQLSTGRKQPKANMQERGYCLI